MQFKNVLQNEWYKYSCISRFYIGNSKADKCGIKKPDDYKNEFHSISKI